MVLLQIILIYYIFLERQCQCTYNTRPLPEPVTQQQPSLGFFNIDIDIHQYRKYSQRAPTNQSPNNEDFTLICASLPKLDSSKQHHRRHQSNTIPTTGFIICKYLENGKYALCPGHGYPSHNGDSIENRTLLKTGYHSSCSIQI